MQALIGEIKRFFGFKNSIYFYSIKWVSIFAIEATFKEVLEHRSKKQAAITVIFIHFF